MSQPMQPQPGRPAGAVVDQQGKPGNRGLLIGLVIGAVVLLGAIGAAFAAVTLLGGGGQTVTLQSFGSGGDAPYTASVAPAPSASLADYAEGAGGEDDLATETDDSGYRRVAGSVPGVFGGTLNELACDAAQLVTFLTAEPEKASSWASVIGIDPADIPLYVDGLTAVNLSQDTRVLDHGFVDGAASAREALLQRGSAVLVDSRGVPRVNCYSGNPLLDPSPEADESYEGEQWANFDVTLVLVIVATPIDQTQLTLLDVTSGGFFDRPAGTGGEADSGGGGESTAEPSEVDPTTEVAAAGAIELNTPVASEIVSSGEELRFEIQAPDSARLTLTVDNQRDSVGRIGVAVIESGTQLEFFRVPAGGTDEFSWTIDDDGGAPFEIVFTEGPAAFEFTVASELQNDAGQGG